MQRLFVTLLLILMFGCSPNCQEDFQKEGEALCRKIALELQKVEATEDLVRLAPLLKKQFNALVDLMMEARDVQEERAWVLPSEAPSGLAPFNELLMIELQRIAGLERGKEIVEGVQREALHRLDAYERELKKRKERLLIRKG